MEFYEVLPALLEGKTIYYPQQGGKWLYTWEAANDYILKYQYVDDDDGKIIEEGETENLSAYRMTDDTWGIYE